MGSKSTKQHQKESSSNLSCGNQPRQVPAGPAVRRHRLREPEGPRQAHPAGAHRDEL